jgi:alanine racemase
MFFKKKTHRSLNLVQVSGSVLRENLALYQQALPDHAICPVVKGNAYGHGLTQVAKALYKEQCPFYIVDSLYECQILERAGLMHPALILGSTFPENLSRDLPYEFGAGDLTTAARLAELKLPAHIEVDTGMSRMGFSMEELPAALSAMKEMGLKVTGLFSHFAEAENPEDSFTRSQETKFAKAIALTHEAGFTPKWIHLGNSDGSLKINLPEVNLSRIGAGLYGIGNLEGEKQALSLKSHLIAVRKIRAGTAVGYGRQFTAEHDMHIGTLPIGYYEGLPRRLSNQAPFLGSVCMNHCMIEVRPESKIGDEVEIYGNIKAIAKQIGTDPREISTRISESLRRRLT